MKNVLESLKSVYKGENQTERHLWYAVLMLLPAITGAFATYIDNDSIGELLPPAVICIIFFGILSIIPSIYLIGIYYQYLRNRLDGETGLPAMNNELFKTGLKALPLVICWGVYFILTVVLLMGIISIPVLAIMLTAALNPLFMFLAAIPLFTALIIVLIAGLTLLMVFFNYININFAETFELRGELFNPFLIFEYVKKSFKKTFITACKYILTGIIAHIGAFIISAVSGIVIFMAWLITSVAAGHAGFISDFFILLFFTISALIDSYVSAVVVFGLSNEMIEIYKELKTAEA